MIDPVIIYQHLSQPLSDGVLMQARQMGMLPKNELCDGVAYAGFCRNARCAKWDASQGLFWYHRDGRRETVPYAADWNDWDLFVPVQEADPYDVACYFE